MAIKERISTGMVSDL